MAVSAATRARPTRQAPPPPDPESLRGWDPVRGDYRSDDAARRAQAIIRTLPTDGSNRQALIGRGSDRNRVAEMQFLANWFKHNLPAPPDRPRGQRAPDRDTFQRESALRALRQQSNLGLDGYFGPQRGGVDRTGRQLRLLQQALGTRGDGVVGGDTGKAMNERNPRPAPAVAEPHAGPERRRVAEPGEARPATASPELVSSIVRSGSILGAAGGNTPVAGAARDELTQRFRELEGLGRGTPAYNEALAAIARGFETTSGESPSGRAFSPRLQAQLGLLTGDGRPESERTRTDIFNAMGIQQRDLERVAIHAAFNQNFGRTLPTEVRDRLRSVEPSAGDGPDKRHHDAAYPLAQQLLRWAAGDTTGPQLGLGDMVNRGLAAGLSRTDQRHLYDQIGQRLGDAERARPGEAADVLRRVLDFGNDGGQRRAQRAYDMLTALPKEQQADALRRIIEMPLDSHGSTISSGLRDPHLRGLIANDVFDDRAKRLSPDVLRRLLAVPPAHYSHPGFDQGRAWLQRLLAEAER